MGDKRWGPVNGPGMTVTRKEGQTGFIQAGALGSSLLTARFERGNPGEITYCSSREDSIRKLGDRYDSYDGPYARDGWFTASGGRGNFMAMRITDGDEIKSYLYSLNRLASPSNAIKHEALNGGRWAGRARTVAATRDGSPGYSGVTISYDSATGDTDEVTTEANVYAGATASDGVSSWTVVSSTNTSAAAGTLTVEADAALSGLGSSLTITLAAATNADGIAKGLAVMVRDGSTNPTTEFRLTYYLDGIVILDYDNMSMTTTAANYFVPLVNADGANHYVRVTDQGVGALAAHRPALAYLTAESMVYTAATGNSVLTDSSEAWTVNQFVGGYLIPNATATTTSERLYRFPITANTADTITVQGDVTDAGTANCSGTEDYRIEFPSPLTHGYDGGTPSDSDYTAVLRLDDSPINAISDDGMNFGLVMMACVGVTSASVLAAERTYCEGRGYHYYKDIPSTIVDRQAAWNFCNVTTGRSDKCITYFGGFFYIPDPDGSGYKLISGAGHVLGRKAAVAADYNGYHQVASGVDLGALPDVAYLPFNWADVNVSDANEHLCPDGIGLIRQKSGRWCMWSGRMLSVSASERWQHQAASLDHWGHVLGEQLEDDHLWKLNNPGRWELVRGHLRDYFDQEYKKEALDTTKTFQEACVIEMNTQTTTASDRQSGDANVVVTLCLPGIIERLNLVLQQGGYTVVPANPDAA